MLSDTTDVLTSTRYSSSLGFEMTDGTKEKQSKRLA
jgi:hypothetical protein